MSAGAQAIERASGLAGYVDQVSAALTGEHLEANERAKLVGADPRVEGIGKWFDYTGQSAVAQEVEVILVSMAAEPTREVTLPTPHGTEAGTHVFETGEHAAAVENALVLAGLTRRDFGTRTGANLPIVPLRHVGGYPKPEQNRKVTAFSLVPVSEPAEVIPLHTA